MPPPLAEQTKENKMKNSHHVAVIVGSLRKGSFNRQVAHELAELASTSLKLEIVEIGHLPLYSCRR